MLMMVTAIPINGIYVNATADACIDVLYNGEETSNVVVAEDEQITLESKLDGVASDAYQWQIRVNEQKDIWADIDGYNQSFCKVSYALVGSLLDNTNTAYLRLVATCADDTYTSETVAVEIVPSESTIYTAVESTPLSQAESTPLPETADVSMAMMPNMEMASFGIAPMAEGDDVTVNKYDIVVNFTYQDSGEEVTAPFAASIAENENFSYNVFVESRAGYAPFYDKDGDGVLEDNEELKPENEESSIYFSIELENIQANHMFEIVYKAVLVNFTVYHYFQNNANDEYTLKYTTYGKQFTGYEAPEDLMLTDDSAVGYTAQKYERLTIAADGSTAINIYYNVNYYLIDYDLAEGRGVIPIYARYGTVVTVKEPTKPGYVFEKWQLLTYDDQEATEEQQAEYNLNTSHSITVPAASLKYLAIWHASETSFTIVYWREAESTVGTESEIKYEYWGSKLAGAILTENGDIDLDGSVMVDQMITPDSITSDGTRCLDVPSEISTISDGNVQVDEINYFHYNKEKTLAALSNGEIKVVGDGTTVLNIYYDRNEYTLKFYYAAKSGNSYYVMGRTNRFGSESISQSTATRNNEVALFDRAWGNNQRRAVDELPEIVNNERYDFGTDTGSQSRTYYYFTFKAKYGADISDYWPTTNDIPAVAGGVNGRSTVFSAWNGESNVYYTRHMDRYGNNETIKGQYRRLDYRALWDPAVTETSNDSIYQNTVSYLAYWCNVVNYDYNYPSLYRYNVYLECVTRHSADTTCELCAGKESKTFTVDGVTKTYYRAAVYDVADNNDTDGTGNLQQQTHPDVYGFTNVNDANGTGLTEGVEYITMASGEYDANVYRNGYELYHFYDRIRYTLQFENEGVPLELTDTGGLTTVRYGVSLYSPEGYDLSDTNNPKMVDENGNLKFYPDTLDPNGYVFEGWYTSPNFASSTRYEFDENSTMPAASLLLFAHWVPVEHSVELYVRYEDIEKGVLFYPTAVGVTHGKYAPTPNEPENENYDFAGWFYQDINENGEMEEYAFVFESIPIMHDMKIYAKWSSNVAVPYTIYYKCLTEDGEVDVAPPTEGTALAGSTQTFHAKTGNQLYSNYRVGFFPEESGSHTLDFKMTEENTFTFIYKEVEAVPYTVRYLEAGTENLLKEDLVVEDNRYTVVTEAFEHITGYMPDAYQKRLIVAADNQDNNVITFYYTQNDTQTYYRIVHYIEGTTQGTYSEYSARETVGNIDATITEDVLNMTGFVFKPEKTKINSTINADAVSVDNKTVSGTISKEGLLMEIYYDRASYRYVVNYLEEGTNKVLSEQKNGQGRYGTTIVENARTITGYELVSASPQTRTITEDGIVIDFHYQERAIGVSYVALEGGSVDIHSENGEMVTGGLVGSVATPDEGYIFLGWYRNEACTTPVNANWVTETKLVPQRNSSGYYQSATYYALFAKETADLLIYTDFPTLNNYKKLDADTTFIYTVEGVMGTTTEDINLTVVLHERDSITIKDLPVGQYRVTQLTEWSWRYTPLRQNYRDITITADGSLNPNVANGNWVRFTNSRTDKSWLDDYSYSTNIFNGKLKEEE